MEGAYVPKDAAGGTKVDAPTHAEGGFDWAPAFLAALRMTGNITASAHAAQISRCLVYKRRDSDRAFRDEMADALDEATDTLEAEARRRALEGCARKQFMRNGEPIIDPETGDQYVEREYSDTLLLALLRAHRPQRFRENRSVELSGPNGGPIDVSQMTPEERKARIDELNRKRGDGASSAPRDRS